LLNANGLRRNVIVIGASAGGVDALIALFERLPASLTAGIAVVLHMHPLHDSRLAEILSRHASMPVVQAVDDMAFEPGKAYIAPPDRHLRVDRGKLTLDRSPKAHFTRPAIDPLFFSAAQAYGKAVVGVILTGRGMDGVSGLVSIKQQGGVSLVQDPSEATFPFMPRAAIREDHVDAVLRIADLAEALERLAEGGTLAVEPPRRS
jgi:two-component system, chemotaxis family, protein-glutamate methylesterase/glutaminase